MDHAFYYEVKDHQLKDVTLIHGDGQTSLAHDIKHSESKSKRVFKPLDAAIIHPIPSLDGNRKWFKTRLGITFEMISLGPPKLVNERPLLRILEEQVSKTIVYQDVCENLYKPMPLAHISDNEAMGWFPCLSRIDPKTGQALILYRDPKKSKQEIVSEGKMSNPNDESEPKRENHASDSLVAKNQPSVGASLSPKVPSPVNSSLKNQQDSQENDHHVTANKGQQTLKLTMSCRPSYYKFDNKKNRVFNLIKRADEYIEPPDEPRVECQVDPMTGQKAYIDACGNVYKMLLLPPWHDIEESRKGGSPPIIEPKGNILGCRPPAQIPPPYSQAIDMARKGGSPPKSKHNEIPPSFDPKVIPPFSQAIEGPKNEESTLGFHSMEISPRPKEVATINVVSQAMKEPLNQKVFHKSSVINGHAQSQEKMLVDKFPLLLHSSGKENLSLYDNGKGTLFELLSLANGKSVNQCEIPKSPIFHKYLHVKLITYTYKDHEGNEYILHYAKFDASNALDASSFGHNYVAKKSAPCLVGMSTILERALPLLRACSTCGIDHLIKDCPSKHNHIKSRTSVDNDKKTHSSTMQPKAKSPPWTPPKRQMLPQKTTDLIRFQLLEFQQKNARMDHCESGNLHDHSTLDTTITSNVSSANDPKREDPMLTTVSVKKDTQSCVIAKPRIVGNTHNQQDHTTSLKDSTTVQEHSQCSPRSSQHPIVDQGAKTIEESHASRPTKLDSIETSQRLNPQHSKDLHCEITSRTKVPPQPRQRIFQPKYPSQRDQKRQQAKKVFVPADSIRVNDSVWLENPKEKQLGKHLGWITSHSSLQAQGYYHGQRKIWLPAQ